MNCPARMYAVSVYNKQSRLSCDSANRGAFMLAPFPQQTPLAITKLPWALPFSVGVGGDGRDGGDGSVRGGVG
jgi:hypothetical protein